MSEMVILRLGHIVPAAFWVGGALLAAFILEPGVRRLDPSVRGPVMSVLGPAMGIAMTVASALAIGFGAALVIRTPGHALGDLFTTRWGWAIGLGSIAAILAFMLGFRQAATVREIGRIMSTAAGRPSPEQASRAGALEGRLTTIGRTNAVLVTIAVAMMAVARFLG